MLLLLSRPVRFALRIVFACVLVVSWCLSPLVELTLLVAPAILLLLLFVIVSLDGYKHSIDDGAILICICPLCNVTLNCSASLPDPARLDAQLSPGIESPLNYRQHD